MMLRSIGILYTKFLSRTFVKFGITGLSGVFVNLGAFQLMLHLNLHALIASPIAIELSIISNFLIKQQLDVQGPHYDGYESYQRFEISSRFNNDACVELWHLRRAQISNTLCFSSNTPGLCHYTCCVVQLYSKLQLDIS